MAEECPMKYGEHLLDDPVAWGRELIRTHDHDPLYTGLWGYAQAGGQNQTDRLGRVRRFMVAYWCCYSVGASWRISEHHGDNFWDWLEVAARNEESPRDLKQVESDRWPRAHERRHWRGQKCVDSVAWLRERFPVPEDAVRSLEDLPGDINLQAVELEVTRWPQFGPWIAFKAADMMERVLGIPVEFPTSITSMYKDPRVGAEMAGPLLGGLVPQRVTDLLLFEYRDMDAPPGGGRKVGVQEVETVLCKWKAARRHGGYWIGADTESHRRELELWDAQELLRHYPTPGA